MKTLLALVSIFLADCAPAADDFFVVLPNAKEVHMVEQGGFRYLRYTLANANAPQEVTNSIIETLTQNGWRLRDDDRLGKRFPLNTSQKWSCQATGNDSEQCFWAGEWERSAGDIVHYGVLVSRRNLVAGRIEVTAMQKGAPEYKRHFSPFDFAALNRFLTAIFGVCLAYLFWLHTELVKGMAQRHRFEWRALGFPDFWANMSPGLFWNLVRYAWSGRYERLRDKKLSDTGYLLQVFYHLTALLAAFWVMSLGL